MFVVFRNTVKKPGRSLDSRIRPVQPADHLDVVLQFSAVAASIAAQYITRPVLDGITTER